jgi:hypothetical protein
MYTAELEEAQRTEKFLEYTHKVYKPSKTITFNREGEVLLFSCDNLRHSKVYTKYPYVMYDAMIPIAWYLFFADPCNNTYLILVGLSWQVRHALFHFSWIFGWMPHHLYIRNLTKRIHRVYLMRGGKYCRFVMADWHGVSLLNQIFYL